MKRERILPPLAALMFVWGCSAETTRSDDASLRASLGTAKAGDLTVELLTQSRLETGMNPLYIKLSDASGQAVTDATVSLSPTMTMAGGMSHGALVIGATMRYFVCTRETCSRQLATVTAPLQVR